MELTRAERRDRVKDFHAEIARRASLVKHPEVHVIHIPNTPFGIPKVRPKPERNVEPDYWHMMWFHDLVYGRPILEPTTLRVEDIIRAAVQEYGVSRLDILSGRRTNDVVRPRQVIAYLAKKLTKQTLPEIGRRLGGRDHTTIIFSVRKIEGLLATDIELAARVEKIKAALA